MPTSNIQDHSVQLLGYAFIPIDNVLKIVCSTLQIYRLYEEFQIHTSLSSAIKGHILTNNSKEDKLAMQN